MSIDKESVTIKSKREDVNNLANIIIYMNGGNLNMSKFENHNSSIGAQGDNMTNQASINAINNADINNNPVLDEQLSELKSIIENTNNETYNKELLDEMEKAKIENNKSNFIKYFNLLKDSIGMISAMVNIANIIF